MIKDYLNKLLSWMGQLDYVALGWELLVLVALHLLGWLSQVASALDTIGYSSGTERVLPEPAARLIGFGDNGMDLELRIWIRDPQEGVANVRSDVNLAIWKGFQAAGISIPFPQQDVRVKELPV